MYNLIVTNDVAEGDPGTVTMASSRFLEYTGESIREQMETLSNEAIEAMKSWPCILMQEGRADEQAYVGQIRNIRRSGNDIVVTASTDIISDRLENDDIWRLRERLDIEQFEFSRHHWAVKEGDPLDVLPSQGIEVGREASERFTQQPLPAPPRQTLLHAMNAIADWGHTEIDTFLLEAGVDGLEAGREVGSRRDRANAIIRYVFENPGAVTAEGSLFSAFVARRTVPTDEEEPETPEGEAAGPRKYESPATQDVAKDRRSPNRVFVVHGRNDDARTEVVDFLTSLGLDSVVLHEQPNMGRHLLTKFIAEAELATFAVVLMTDDDVGGRNEEELSPRARQNVILELGYFLSHLGQPNVCALVTPGLDTPSDFDGIVYIQMTDDSAWQEELERELRAAELPVN